MSQQFLSHKTALNVFTYIVIIPLDSNMLCLMSFSELLLIYIFQPYFFSLTFVFIKTILTSFTNSPLIPTQVTPRLLYFIVFNL